MTAEFPSNTVNVKSLGAKGDVITYASSGVSITSGSASLTVTGASFVANDVGKSISIPGAGAAGGTLFTTIFAYVSATQVTLAANAGTTLSAVAATIFYGSDDTSYMAAAQTAAGAGGEVYLPLGTYLITAAVTLTNSVRLRGASRVRSVLKLGVAATITNFITVSSAQSDLTKLTVDASNRVTNAAVYYCTGVSDVTLDSIIVKGGYNGVHFVNNSNVLAKNCQFIANGFQQVYYHNDDQFC